MSTSFVVKTETCKCDQAVVARVHTRCADEATLVQGRALRDYRQKAIHHRCAFTLRERSGLCNAEEAGSKYAKCKTGHVHDADKFVDWEKKARIHMIANQRVIGPSLMLHPRVSASVQSQRSRHNEQYVRDYFPGQGTMQAVVFARQSDLQKGVKKMLNVGSCKSIKTHGSRVSCTTSSGGMHIGSVASGMALSRPWCPFRFNPIKKWRVRRLHEVKHGVKKESTAERTRLMSWEGREIVGPGYTSGKNAARQRNYSAEQSIERETAGFIEQSTAGCAGVVARNNTVPMCDSGEFSVGCNSMVRNSGAG